MPPTRLWTLFLVLLSISFSFASKPYRLSRVRLHGADDFTENYHVLKRVPAKADDTPSAQLTAVWNGTANDYPVYHIPVQIRGKSYNLLLDTGSSDTWLIQEGFQCISGYISRSPEPSWRCYHGPVFNDSIEDTQVFNRTFFLGYGGSRGGFGGGAFLMGNMSYENVSFAGLTVRGQEVGLASSGNYNGVLGSSGILGLGYSALTSSYYGDRPENGYQNKPRAQYDSITTSIFAQNLSSPSFSLALNRGAAGQNGYIAFGGLPPVNITSAFASTPIELLKTRRNLTDLRHTAYAITPDAIVYNGSNSTQADQYVVDSGTPVTLLPQQVLKEVHALFRPPGQYLNDWQVACNATAPEFGIKIGGTVFRMNLADMIQQRNRHEDTGLCSTGLQDWTSSAPYILGDTFLQNVVAVFDVEGNEMRFAKHEY